MEQLKLRKANAQDELLLFCWANDPVVRANAFSTEAIALANHHRWYEKALGSANTQIYLLEKDDLPVGQVRLEEQDDEYIIDYSIDAAWRGHGYGLRILALVEECLTEGAILVGKVKKGNMPSRQVFLSLGYQEYMNDNREYVEYRKFVLCTGGGQGYSV